MHLGQLNPKLLSPSWVSAYEPGIWCRQCMAQAPAAHEGHSLAKQKGKFQIWLRKRQHDALELELGPGRLICVGLCVDGSPENGELGEGRDKVHLSKKSKNEAEKQEVSLSGPGMFLQEHRKACRCSPTCGYCVPTTKMQVDTQQDSPVLPQHAPGMWNTTPTWESAWDAPAPAAHSAERGTGCVRHGVCLRPC